jgi:hypothetical protein
LNQDKKRDLRESHKEKVMKHATIYRKFVAMLALGALLSLNLVPRAKAFTLVEIHYLPAVQVVAGQLMQVSASNFSNASVSATLNITNAAGAVVATKTAPIAASKTVVLGYTNGDTTASYSAVVEVSAANSVASNFQVFGSNGQTAALTEPYINSTLAVQNTPAVRLTPGQSGAAAITNITAEAVTLNFVVINNAGTTVLSESATLGPGATGTYPFTNTGTVDQGYRAVVTTQAENTVTSSVMTFDDAGQPIICDDGHVKW